MNIFTLLYNEVFFRPLFNLLVGVTNLLPTHNVGISIIVVTAIVRVILFPSALHQARHLGRNQQKMADVQQDIKAINEKYKNDPAQKSKATLALYKKAGINPAAGCLPLLVQLPILIALYRVFLIGMGPDTWHSLYAFVGAPTALQLSFLGINLNEPSVRLAVIAGVAQFFQMRLAMAATPSPAGDNSNAQLMASMQRNMQYIFPVMTVFISIQLPAALGLYWVVSTLLGIVQHYAFRRFLKISVSTPMM